MKYKSEIVNIVLVMTIFLVGIVAWVFAGILLSDMEEDLWAYVYVILSYCSVATIFFGLLEGLFIYDLVLKVKEDKKEEI